MTLFQGYNKRSLKKTHNTIEKLYDQAPAPLLSRNWILPPAHDDAWLNLEIASEVFAKGKHSPLYKMLVDEHQLATNVNFILYPAELVSTAELTVTLKDDSDFDKVSKLLDEKIAELIQLEISTLQLKKAKTRITAKKLSTLDRHNRRSRLLLTGELATGNPNLYKHQFNYLTQATVKDVSNSASYWFNQGYHQLNVIPTPKFTTQVDGADRSKLPALSKIKENKIPLIEKFTLNSGINVSLINDDSIPMLAINAQISPGFSLENANNQGISRAILSLLDKGNNHLLQKRDRASITKYWRAIKA